MDRNKLLQGDFYGKLAARTRITHATVDGSPQKNFPRLLSTKPKIAIAALNSCLAEVTIAFLRDLRYMYYRSVIQTSR